MPWPGFKDFECLREFARTPCRNGRTGPWQKRINASGIFSALVDSLVHTDPQLRSKTDLLQMIPKYLGCAAGQSLAEMF